MEGSAANSTLASPGGLGVTGHDASVVCTDDEVGCQAVAAGPQKHSTNLEMAYLNREHAPALDSGRKAIKVNYTLKQDLALCKKRAACDRLPYKVRENKTSTSVTLNTVAFEYFRGFIVGYLKSDCFKYKVEGPKPVIDKSGNVTADVIRVFGSDGFHLLDRRRHGPIKSVPLVSWLVS